MRLGSENPGLSHMTIPGAGEVPGTLSRLSLEAISVDGEVGNWAGNGDPAALGWLNPSPSENEREEVPRFSALAETDHSDSKG
jgi:hypothetical protein